MKIEVIRQGSFNKWGPDILYTKGHVNTVEFSEAAQEYAQNDPGNGYFQAGHPYYAWLRKVPGRLFCYRVLDAVPQSRGAFPATVGCMTDCMEAFTETKRHFE